MKAGRGKGGHTNGDLTAGACRDREALARGAGEYGLPDRDRLPILDRAGTPSLLQADRTLTGFEEFSVTVRVVSSPPVATVVTPETVLEMLFCPTLYWK